AQLLDPLVGVDLGPFGGLGVEMTVELRGQRDRGHRTPGDANDAARLRPAATTASTVTPSRQSGTWPTQRSGGRRTPLHGLQGGSTRTMRCSATSGAYRQGIDGPKTATTGVPTAAARCIGPVSPVSSSWHCFNTPARITRSTVPCTRMVVTPACLRA